MGLNREEQQNVAVRGLNDFCYGAFRYSWHSEENEAQCKQLVRAAFKLMGEELKLSADQVSGIIGLGRIYNSGYLERVLRACAQPTTGK